MQHGTELREHAERLLDLARRAGADEAQVSASHDREIKVGFERNELSLSASGEETSLRLRVHHQHRLGAASTNSTDRHDLERAVEAAMAMASFSPPDEHLNLPFPAPLEERPDLWDESIVSVGPEQLRSMAEEFLRALREDARVSIDSGNVSSELDESWLLNTHGIAVRERQTRLAWLGSGQGLDGDDITNFDYGGGMSYRLEGARERMLVDGRRMARQIAGTFGAGTGVSYKGCVLLSPRALEELVLDPLESHLSGLQVFYGKSNFTDDKLGTPVTSPLFSLEDDPTDPLLVGCTAWDSEGVPTSRRTFIERGVLRLQMENAYSAKRRGRSLTGHCGFGLHGAKVASGETPLADLVSGRQPLLVVHRFSGNVDAQSGDFSGVAKGSHLHAAGERRPISETMISGNLFAMLRCIEGVSREVETVENGYVAPWILFDGISVTAQDQVGRP
ncbi:MAG: TldD/PmbA family protein [Candidatus Eisenbacteria bacterium]|nr:TldD/PmbA family protein [Candidatus Eisenbacteria bacterium]